MNKNFSWMVKGLLALLAAVVIFWLTGCVGWMGGGSGSGSVITATPSLCIARYEGQTPIIVSCADLQRNAVVGFTATPSLCLVRTGGEALVYTVCGR